MNGLRGNDSKRSTLEQKAAIHGYLSKHSHLRKLSYGYAADFTPHPTYVCLPSGLFKARTGRIVEKTARNGRSSPYREFTHQNHRWTVRCITQEHIPKGGQLIWNVEFLTIFVPVWMIPTIHHSLRRECIKNEAHSHEYGVRSVRPTWFEDWKMPPKQELANRQDAFQPMHGLKLVIKEDVCRRNSSLFSSHRETLPEDF